MKVLKLFILSALSILFISGFSGCNKLSHNGKLDGQWQIMTIEQSATGDLSFPEHEYIRINLHILQLWNNADRQTANMIYDKKGGVINCDFPYIKEKDITALLVPYGIYTNPVEFDILKLDGKSLILKTDRTVISCRRF